MSERKRNRPLDWYDKELLDVDPAEARAMERLYWLVMEGTWHRGVIYKPPQRPRATEKKPKIICGARTRYPDHHPCRCKPFEWPDGYSNSRCHLHGGKSLRKSPPKSPAGIAAISKAAKLKWERYRAAKAAANRSKQN